MAGLKPPTPEESAARERAAWAAEQKKKVLGLADSNRSKLQNTLRALQSGDPEQVEWRRQMEEALSVRGGVSLADYERWVKEALTPPNILPEAPTTPARSEPAPAAAPRASVEPVPQIVVNADIQMVLSGNIDKPGFQGKNGVLERLLRAGYIVVPEGLKAPDGTILNKVDRTTSAPTPTAPEAGRNNGVNTAELIRRYLVATRDSGGAIVVPTLNDVIRGIGQRLIEGSLTVEQRDEILKAILPSESSVMGVVLNGVLDKVEDTIYGIGQAVERGDADRAVDALIDGSMNAHSPTMVESRGVVVDRGVMREKVVRAGAALRDLRRAGVIYRISASGQVEDALHEMVGEIKRKREDIGNIREDTVQWIQDAINSGLISRDGLVKAFEMMADPEAAGFGALIKDAEGKKVLYASSQFNPEQLLTAIGEKVGADKLTIHMAWMIREVVQARMSNEFLQKYAGKAECDWLTILDLESYFTKKSNQSPTKNSPVQVVAEGGLAHLGMQYPSYYRSRYPSGGLREIGALAGNGLDMRGMRVGDLPTKWAEALSGKRGASGKGLPRDLMDGVVDAYEVSMFLMKPDLLIEGGKYAGEDLNPEKAWATMLGGLNRLILQGQISAEQRDHVVRIMIDTVFAKFDPNSPTFDTSLEQVGDGTAKRIEDMKSKCKSAVDAMRAVFGNDTNYLLGANGRSVLSPEDRAYYESAYRYYYDRLDFPKGKSNILKMGMGPLPFRIRSMEDPMSRFEKGAVIPVIDAAMDPLNRMSRWLARSLGRGK